jgi:hypothetical protein
MFNSRKNEFPQDLKYELQLINPADSSAADATSTQPTCSKSSRSSEQNYSKMTVKQEPRSAESSYVNRSNLTINIRRPLNNKEQEDREPASLKQENFYDLKRLYLKNVDLKITNNDLQLIVHSLTGQKNFHIGNQNGVYIVQFLTDLGLFFFS